MNQDFALSKRTPDTLYSGDNFQITTSDGLSSGNLVNSKGMTEAFAVPNIAEMTLTDGTVIPAQTSLKIIGTTVMIDELIILTTQETSATPDGYGQIWKCKFDELTGVIEGVTGAGFLDPAVHLFYNQKLNLSTAHRVGRIVAINETATKHRIYWTDNYNPVRVFNLAAVAPLDTSLDNIALFPAVKHIQPTITELGPGTLPTGVKAQVAYRLADKNGAVTVVSPPSPMVSLVSGEFTPSVYGDFEGGTAATNNKSITYDLVGLDTDYTVIEHLVIIYEQAGPKVWLFDTQNVPSSGKLTITCSTLTDATEIVLTDYSLISSGFSKAKDITVQGNRLVAANITTRQFDIAFDARAYRFNSSNDALLTDSVDPSNNITLAGASPLYTSVEEEHDAINIHNHESELTWATPVNQYKYKTGGTVLGGSGPNISYEFVTQDIVGNFASGLTTSPDHIHTTPFSSGASPLATGVLEADGTGKGVAIAGQWNSFASSWAHNNYSGGARGEVYRYAIVVYDHLGGPSFAKWIGDIRFPDVIDGFPLQTESGTYPILHNIGIKFSVDVSSISDQISGYGIVRVDRTEEHRTKLGTGMYMLFDTQRIGSSSSLMHTYNADATGEAHISANPFPTGANMNIYGVDDHSTMHLADKPGFHYYHGAYGASTYEKRFGYLMGPAGQLASINHRTEDYIETLSYYGAKATNYMNANTDSASDRSFGFYYKVGANYPNPHEAERFEVEEVLQMDLGEFVPANTGFADGAGGKSIMNATEGVQSGPSSAQQFPLGIGSKMLAIKLHTSSTLPNQSSHDAGTGGADTVDPQVLLNWKGHTFDGPSTTGGTTLTWNGPETNQDVYFKEVGYRRYLAKQYGGDTFVNRGNNEYISCGHYQVVTDVAAASAAALEFNVFGGDTYVNYYDDEKAEQYWDPSQNYKQVYKEQGNNKLSLAFTFPVESVNNTEYRQGTHWAKSREGSNMGFYISNDISQAGVWSYANNAQKKFFAKDFQSEFNESHPHLLWASDVKINGELRDNWRVFKIASRREVDGIYGPINRVVSFNDNLVFLQDTAVGIASLDERSVLSDESGQQLVLGVGGVFPQYKYVSTTAGTIHQFSVVASATGLYFFDARTRKFMSYSGRLNSLSDINGMSSFFANNINGAALTTDETLATTPAGIHGTYDPRHNRVIYTVLGTTGAKDYTLFLDATTGIYTYPAGEFIDYNGVSYFMHDTYAGTDPDIPAQLLIMVGDKPSISASVTDPAFTFAFNEFTSKFENFYDYHPGMYVEYGRRLLSVSPFANDKLFEHNKGIRGMYYDTVKSISRLHIVFNAESDATKIFNNVEYFAELQDSNKLDIFNETFNRVRFYNEYQDTGMIDLTVEGNIKRRMRKWRLQIPRDKDVKLSRMRNPWLHCVFEFDNNLDKRLVVHDIIHAFTPNNN